ncbi:ATP-dependent DNA helicase [Campylobacter pinnipediorum]|uniref:ATP-dependent DNA helicase n=1 Tax=Campylobacter pinnipediorum TaxID=1965231 RepID=UPI00084D2944|nr:ATP-dependent RecD-like DNA helicase [Campylobacter pinnipediorum]
MKKIIEKIKVLNQNICKNIENTTSIDRGFFSQNILNIIRNLIEHVSLYIYCKEKNITLEFKYDNLKNAAQKVHELKKEFHFLYKFHKSIQIVSSHYTQTEEGSERLILKYYEYLLRIKLIFEEKYNITLLNNLDKFPTYLDTNLKEYYENILNALNKYYNNVTLKNNNSNDRFYIHKKKPIIISNQVFYELSLTIATDDASKFDRFIVFTKDDVMTNYAIQGDIEKRNITILNKKTSINIIDNIKISIRPCEIDNFIKLFIGYNLDVGRLTERERISDYITQTGNTLLDIINLSDSEYDKLKNNLTKGIRNEFFNILDKCKEIIINKRSSHNIIRYLLYTFTNSVIKKVYCNKINNRLSNLYIDNKNIPFDQMPFATSLYNHNPKISDLLNCIDHEGREHEFLSKAIKNNTENNKKLYTNIDELNKFSDINRLMKTFYNNLYYKHKEIRKLEKWNNYVYIKNYEKNVVNILQTLKSYSQTGLSGYENFAKAWLDSFNEIDDETKTNTIKNLFLKSKVTIIYGAAGTGKSTLMNYISKLFNDKSKIFLAQTNPAVENIKRRVDNSQNKSMTIQKFKNSDSQKCDLLFIDECSTISNADMLSILNNAKFELLILVGDVYQIESIGYGNWFEIIPDFLPEYCVHELTKTYRSDDIALVEFWDKVRKIDDNVMEFDVVNKYSFKINEDIFIKKEDDEIILCLNYDGLYGINNINKFLQSQNNGKSVSWGIWTFKVGDPVLFTENNMYYKILHNNLKGTIKKIIDNGNEVYFEVEINKVISEIDLMYDMKLINNSENSSLISFSISKNTNSDNDDSKSNIPFQIAYAVSIHKSQGLEYNSVKVIITNEIEEQITHSIFYTAITRAKKNLKIYWSPETQNKVIKEFKKNKNKQDSNIIKAKNKI